MCSDAFMTATLRPSSPRQLSPHVMTFRRPKSEMSENVASRAELLTRSTPTHAGVSEEVDEPRPLVAEPHTEGLQRRPPGTGHRRVRRLEPVVGREQEGHVVHHPERLEVVEEHP